MAIELGQLRRENPRTVWANESRDFTPWVAEHLEQLGAVLDMDLELVRAESDVGDFSIDVLARDLSSQHLVVIENQLEQTDHTHLGQLITYAAGVEAGAVVWITPQFRDEHRQAIDWLNHGLGTTTRFFAVAVEVLRIDGSKPAVSFRVVAKPPGYKVPSGIVDPTIVGRSERGERYQTFFQRLIDELRETHKFTNARAGQPQNWYSFSAGVRGFNYSASFVSGGQVCAELYIDVGDDDRNLAVLNLLRGQQTEIQGELGEALDWQELPERRACRVALYRQGTILDAQERLDEYHTWLVQRLLALKRVFGPRLRAAAEFDRPAN